MAHNSHNSRLGIWHTTTLQSANKQTYQTTTVVGQKRSIEESLPAPANSSSGSGSGLNQIANKRSLTTPHPGGAFLNEPSRLTASTVEHADGHVVDGAPSEYSQRRAVAATPTSTVEPGLSLSHPVYGLPRQLVTNFSSLGIKTIYPWQKQCLLGPGLLQGEKNLVYSAPTGGCKSLVADVLMLKRVLEDRDAKAILVLPYVALVQEKVRWLRSVVNGISRAEHLDQNEPDSRQQLWARRADKDTIRVVGFFGGSRIRATWADFDIAVCTIEKVCNTNRHGPFCNV